MSSKLKVVIDTNVFISAILFKGQANELVSLWQNKELIFLLSREVLEEYIKVLSYPKFRLTMREIRDIIERQLLAFIQPIKVEKRFNIIKEDPPDNKFVSLAVQGRADYILSGDKHLLELKEFKGIKIISLKEFLRIKDGI